jgi:hypothetical protein
MEVKGWGGKIRTEKNGGGPFRRPKLTLSCSAEGKEESSIDWTKLSMFLPEDRGNPVSEKLVKKKKNRTMDNVPKHNHCTSMMCTLKIIPCMDYLHGVHPVVYYNM